jgi:AcrR family transcriptional regulator
MSEIKKHRRSPWSHGKAEPDSRSIRERILQAAFTLFRDRGFSSTSMLEIVTRARVSKRDLYALFNNKHAVLAAGISERAKQMRRPLGPATPAPQTRDALATLLVELRVSLLKTVSHPEVLTVFRLLKKRCIRVCRVQDRSRLPLSISGNPLWPLEELRNLRTPPVVAEAEETKLWAQS